MTGITILDLRDSPWVDGPGRTILDCAASLRERGIDVVVGSFSGGGQKSSAYADEAARRGLTVKTIIERRAFDHRVVSRVIELIDDLRVDIVHTHDFRSNVFGLMAAKYRRKPVITTVHGWIANDLKGKLYVAADKTILRFFDHIITVSERTRTVVKRAWIPDNRLSVIPNALKLDGYMPDRRDDSFRRELGIASDTMLVANIGRLSPEKGQLEFLQAAKLLVERGVNAKFLLIGIGPDQAALERFVADHKLESRVVFSGFRHDMISVYNSVDLVVQSSYTEGMPNVVLEALLMEVPVVATDVGGTAEVLKHRETGMLIRSGVVNDIVEQVTVFCLHPGDLRGMAKRGRLDIRARFDHRQRVDRLAAVYERQLRRAD